MENIPLTETGKETIARDVSGLDLVSRTKLGQDRERRDVGVPQSTAKFQAGVIHHEPSCGSESEIYPDSESESDKCLDFDVFPRDVEESWITGTETIASDVFGLDLFPPTKVGQDQEQRILIRSGRNRSGLPSETIARDVLDLDPVYSVGTARRRICMACVIHHKPNYGSESDKCPDSESESDKCPDSDVCPRVDIGESWKTGLFDCHKNKAIAAVVTFCPCVAFGQIAEVLDEGEMTCPMGSFKYILMMPVLCSQWIIGSMYRKKLRRKLNLVEAPYEDWASHLFCQYCSLCQEYRELQIRGLNPSLGWKGIHARQQGIQQGSQDLVQCPPRTQAMSK